MPRGTPAPRKLRWWQHKSAPKPRSSPSATPEPSAPPEPTVQVEPSPVPHHVSSEAAAPSPSAAPIHKKVKSSGNWFSSLFGPRHRRTKLVPVPAPSATPESLTHKHHKKPTAESSPTPGAEATPAPEATAPESTPKPKPSTLSEQVPFVPPAEKPETTESSQAPMVETRTPEEEEADESSHFQAAKSKAMADPHILDLQSKADSATGDDAIAASKRYYRALYEKMRDLDPGIKDRIDRTEAATLRRVEQENTQ
jgi:type VI secretion system secreted protein VgrG